MNTGAKQKSPQNKTIRKPYQKPRLEKVRLVPDEAVLAACKGTIGFASGSIVMCQAGCLEIGS